jgi:hypothetical protein
MRDWLGETRRAPWTLWALLAISIVWTAVADLVSPPHLPDGFWPFLAFAVLFTLVLWFFLLRGSRIAWWFIVVSLALGLVFSIVGADPWHRFPGSIVSLALLLAPPSRRYVFRPRPSSKASPRPPGTSWDPDDYDDDSRPPAWYFDPSDSSRMRYWDPKLGGWQSKTTRAPRKLPSPASSPARPVATTWDSTAYDDEDRPPGWYLDPSDSTRMRYWDDELGGWQAKTTRAPGWWRSSRPET